MIQLSTCIYSIQLQFSQKTQNLESILGIQNPYNITVPSSQCNFFWNVSNIVLFVSGK